MVIMPISLLERSSTKHELSVASQLASAEGLSVTNLSSENNLLMFPLDAPVVNRVKVKKCEQTLLFHFRPDGN